MEDDTRIRPATAADAAAISGLISSLAHFFLVNPADQAAAAPFYRTIAAPALAEGMREGRLRYHLAERQGEVVGVVGIRDNTHLYHLFVAEAMHRRGLARRLWAVARADAEARGNPDRFTVNSSIFGLPLYRRLGFRATGPRAEQDNIAWVPMEWAAGDPATP